MLPSHNSWRTAKVNGPALNLVFFFISSIVGPSRPVVCKSLEPRSKNWKRAERGPMTGVEGTSLGAFSGLAGSSSRPRHAQIDRGALDTEHAFSRYSCGS